MMPPEHSYDALVVGGGLVGASCAIALARCGLKVGLLDKRQAPAIAVANMQLDSRVYSITPANAAWLTSLGVWAKLDPERISTIDEMEIWGDADAQAKNEATLRFQADGIRVPHLAFVLEEQVLQTALQMVLDKLEVDIITGEAAALEIGSSDAHMQLADGLALQAKLVVA
ncbi:MAG TPA: FAD-dependent oxidoreductase, partial [Methylophilaceae bacterium]|nr:FAD-dependent oxidoreductase [Methylophilaceae bacterium]